MKRHLITYKNSIFRRLLAAFLSLTLFFTQVLFANAAEKSLWEQRRQSIEQAQHKTKTDSQILLAQLTSPMSHPLAQSGTQAQRLPTSSIIKRFTPKNAKAPSSELSSLVSLLSMEGVVRDIKLGKGSSTVIYIQDVHGHLEAQKNISSMILKVLAFDPNAVVGLEGSAGKIPMASFRQASPEINKEIGSFFLNKGLITGAEYAGFATPSAPQMVGVEDANLYLENVAAVREALPQQKAQLTKVAKEKIQLQLKKQKTFSPAMLALDQQRQGYQEDTVNMGDYLSHLKGLAAPSAAFPTTALFLKTWTLEKELNFDKAERERNQFLSRLVENLSKPELEQLVEQSLALRSGAIAYPDYYQLIKETAIKAGVQLSQTPEFDRYINYVLQADSIQPEALLSEIPQYEKAVWSSMGLTSEQMALVQSSVQLGLIEKLVRLTLTSSEWNEYNKLSFLPLGEGQGEGSLTPFESFYQAAEARNATLSSNLKSNMGIAKTAILVAGGFHTEGLTKILAKGDVTLVTVSPKLAHVDGNKDNEYLNVFTREKTPLEKLFESPKITIVESLATHPIGLNPTGVVIKGLVALLAAPIGMALLKGSALVDSGGKTITAAIAGSALPSSAGEMVLQGTTDSGLQIAVYGNHPVQANVLGFLADMDPSLLIGIGIFGFIVGAVIWLAILFRRFFLSEKIETSISAPLVENVEVQSDESPIQSEDNLAVLFALKTIEERQVFSIRNVKLRRSRVGRVRVPSLLPEGFFKIDKPGITGTGVTHTIEMIGHYMDQNSRVDIVFLKTFQAPWMERTLPRTFYRVLQKQAGFGEWIEDTGRINGETEPFSMYGNRPTFNLTKPQSESDHWLISKESEPSAIPFEISPNPDWESLKASLKSTPLVMSHRDEIIAAAKISVRTSGYDLLFVGIEPRTDTGLYIFTKQPEPNEAAVSFQVVLHRPEGKTMEFYEGDAKLPKGSSSRPGALPDLTYGFGKNELKLNTANSNRTATLNGQPLVDLASSFDDFNLAKVILSHQFHEFENSDQNVDSEPQLAQFEGQPWPTPQVSDQRRLQEELNQARKNAEVVQAQLAQTEFKRDAEIYRHALELARHADSEGYWLSFVGVEDKTDQAIILFTKSGDRGRTEYMVFYQQMDGSYRRFPGFISTPRIITGRAIPVTYRVGEVPLRFGKEFRNPTISLGSNSVKEIHPSRHDQAGTGLVGFLISAGLTSQILSWALGGNGANNSSVVHAGFLNGEVFVTIITLTIIVFVTIFVRWVRKISPLNGMMGTKWWTRAAEFSGKATLFVALLIGAAGDVLAQQASIVRASLVSTQNAQVIDQRPENRRLVQGPSLVKLERNEDGVWLNVNGTLESGVGGYAYTPSQENTHPGDYTKKHRLAHMYSAALPIDPADIVGGKYAKLKTLYAPAKAGELHVAPRGDGAALAENGALLLRTYGLLATSKDDAEMCSLIFDYLYDKYGIMILNGGHRPTEQQVDTTLPVVANARWNAGYTIFNEINHPDEKKPDYLQVEAITKLIKKLDKNHPVIFVLTQNVESLLPMLKTMSFDGLGVNVYNWDPTRVEKFLDDLNQRLRPDQFAVITELGTYVNSKSPSARAEDHRLLAESLIRIPAGVARRKNEKKQSAMASPFVIWYQWEPKTYDREKSRHIQGTPAAGALKIIHKQYIPGPKAGGATGKAEVKPAAPAGERKTLSWTITLASDYDKPGEVHSSVRFLKDAENKPEGFKTVTDVVVKLTPADIKVEALEGFVLILSGEKKEQTLGVFKFTRGDTKGQWTMVQVFPDQKEKKMAAPKVLIQDKTLTLDAHVGEFEAGRIEIMSGKRTSQIPGYGTKTITLNPKGGAHKLSVEVILKQGEKSEKNDTVLNQNTHDDPSRVVRIVANNLAAGPDSGGLSLQQARGSSVLGFLLSVGLTSQIFSWALGGSDGPVSLMAHAGFFNDNITTLTAVLVVGLVTLGTLFVHWYQNTSIPNETTNATREVDAKMADKNYRQAAKAAIAKLMGKVQPNLLANAGWNGAKGMLDQRFVGQVQLTQNKKESATPKELWPALVNIAYLGGRNSQSWNDTKKILMHLMGNKISGISLIRFVSQWSRGRVTQIVLNNTQTFWSGYDAIRRAFPWAKPEAHVIHLDALMPEDIDFKNDSAAAETWKYLQSQVRNNKPSKNLRILTARSLDSKELENSTLIKNAQEKVIERLLKLASETGIEGGMKAYLENVQIVIEVMDEQLDPERVLANVITQNPALNSFEKAAIRLYTATPRDVLHHSLRWLVFTLEEGQSRPLTRLIKTAQIISIGA